MAALVGKATPRASTIDAMVDAVPIVMQWPALRAMQLSASSKSLIDILPAAIASENCQTAVPDPTVWPRKRPFNMGPPERTIAGTSQLAAPISRAGVVLSQPVIRTTPSIGLPRIDSSTSMLARLRNNIAVGRRLVSPNDITGNSNGTPPACHTPSFTF